MKVALVHDQISEYGGAERVLEAMHEIWPKAPVFTSYLELENLGPHAPRFKNWDIQTSWLQKVWPIRKLISPLRFLAPLIWQSFDFAGFDLVISSSGWFMCKGVRVKKPPIHICYLHHPPRHLYGYQTARDWQKFWPVKIYGVIINFFLRHYDFATSQRVDYFIANSHETKRRIEKFYRRDAVVIYPPVKIQSSKFKVQSHNPKLKSDGYYLVVSRLARAKNIDLIIRVANRLKFPLWIVGEGREKNYLQSLAGPTVKFLGQISDEKMPEIYQQATAFIFTGIDEEFGIAPVEAMGYGLPVIALNSGGIAETVLDGQTGILFDKLTEESLEKALGKFEGMIKEMGAIREIRENCISQAKRFSQERFKKEILQFVEKVTG